MSSGGFIRLCKGLTGMVAWFVSLILTFGALSTANIPGFVFFFMILIGSSVVCLEALTNRPMKELGKEN